MPLDEKIRERVERSIAVVDEHGTRGRRLVEDARRLWSHLRHLFTLNLVDSEVRFDSLELATYALQFPMQRARTAQAGKAGRTSLRDRAEQSAELLVTHFADYDKPDEVLLDYTTRTLVELPQAKPAVPEARLLADAVNLDDFGLVGMLQYAAQIARNGEGVPQLLESARKRDVYGYWEARLKDGFHFEPVRAIAVKRLATYRHVATVLADELQEHTT